MIELEQILSQLEGKPRLYVEARLRGLTIKAAEAAAGAQREGLEWRAEVQRVLAEAHAATSRATGITIEKLTEMLLDSYRSAATAGEQVSAVRELGKLHGLYKAPEVKIKHEHTGTVRSINDFRGMSVEQLEKIVSERATHIIEGELAEHVPRIGNGG